jgi:predicted AlkP superfamily phosphohydrolase/phosphomutase
MSYLDLLKKAHHVIKQKIPPAGLEWMKRKFPTLRQKVKSRIVFSDVDWRRTKVWSFGRESTNLFINQKGRFPEGIVEPGEEYDALRDQLIESLKTIIDPDTGKAAVGRVLKGEDVYHGACMETAPDLLVTWRDHQYTSWPGYNDRNRDLFEPSLEHSDFSDWSQLQKGGNHRPNGILFMKGDAIMTGQKLEGSRIIDLAPTILHLLGIPVPDDMDGRVLVDAIKADYLQKHPVSFSASTTDGCEAPSAPAYSDEDAARVEERLRSLGYIE